MPCKEVRLEVNIDVTKSDIAPEQVRQAVRNLLDRLGIYMTCQSVLIVEPKKK
jgi:hypothetical protein